MKCGIKCIQISVLTFQAVTGSSLLKRGSSACNKQRSTERKFLSSFNASVRVIERQPIYLGMLFTLPIANKEVPQQRSADTAITINIDSNCTLSTQWILKA